MDNRASAAAKPSSTDTTIEHRHRNRVSAAPCRKPLGPSLKPARLGNFSRMMANFRSKLRKKATNSPNSASQVSSNRVRKPNRPAPAGFATGLGEGGKVLIC
ncbi:hypothetical protein D3C72_1598480 [compost metagenome]